MDLKAVKVQIFHGSIARRVLLRAFFLAAVVSIAPLVHFLSGPYLKMFGAPTASVYCPMHMGESTPNVTSNTYLLQGRFLNPFWGSIEAKQCEEYMNLTANVVRELEGKQLLNRDVNALCVGEGSAVAALALRNLGFSDAYDADARRFFSLKRKQFVYELDYQEKAFSFVFARDLDMVTVPALLVLEIERVLSPGGIGAVLVGISGSPPTSLIRSATPISSALKSSSIVHVNHVNNLTLVVFKKRNENTGYFEQYRLPADCPSLTINRPFIEQMEPLVKEKPMDSDKGFSYLPKFVDLSSKKRFVYVDIGAGKHLNSNVTNWFLPSYPIERRAFNVYFVDHNTSVMLSYVRKPGITFVYHPGLAGYKDNISIDDGGLEPFLGETGFDFVAWFKETLQYADFVVLKMNAGKVELKFLSQLFESGAICYVDELFLHCSGSVDGEESSMPVDCMELLKDLRNSGVFVHQWWGDHNPTSIS